MVRFNQCFETKNHNIPILKNDLQKNVSSVCVETFMMFTNIPFCEWMKFWTTVQLKVSGSGMGSNLIR